VPREHQRELAFIPWLNSMLRLDDATAAPYLAVIVTAINTLLVTRRDGMAIMRFPRNGKTYRGGGLPAQHRVFFTPGKMFRVAGFLATSFLEAKAQEFMCMADRRGEPCVMWEVRLDPEAERLPARRSVRVSVCVCVCVCDVSLVRFALALETSVAATHASPTCTHTHTHTHDCAGACTSTT